ncbi:MAG: saccharopine dehydrogenase NADP-binding domain-containing protein [Candidatus Schekmanbacteria bacterium]|nr:saccharopine dehydrogenase NADP-binding domain-containing protein [Candidatus Schekmanbacteria bacterium]
MDTSAPVFVYGATGYTGRLVCEELARRGIAITVGGRDQAKLAAWCADLRDAEARPRAVRHQVADLAEAFAGATVVVNCSGPFGLLGLPVVEAALRAGCHYLDTTGEQDFMLAVRDRFATAAEQAGRVVINGNSWYYALGSCCCELCLEVVGVDTLRVLYAPRGKPTRASLQSLLRTAQRPGFAIANGALVPNRFDAVVVQLPGSIEVRDGMAIPTGEVAYYRTDRRVRNLRGVMVAEVAAVRAFFNGWYYLSKIIGPRLDDLGDGLVSRFYSSPPPENPAETRFIVSALGEGDAARVCCDVFGSAPYIVTGFLCAEAAARLLAAKHLTVGVTSTAQAFGAEEILDSLGAIGVSAAFSDLLAGSRRRLGAAVRR